MGGEVGKRYAVVDIGYSGEARGGGGRLGRSKGQGTVFLSFMISLVNGRDLPEETNPMDISRPLCFSPCQI